MAKNTPKMRDLKLNENTKYRISSHYKAPVGKPLALPSVDQFHKNVISYFDLCNKKNIPATKLGIACHLGVTMRTLQAYAKRKGYSEVMIFATQLIEQQLTLMLYDKKFATAGLIFNLINNHGWTNVQRTELSGTVNLPKPPVIKFIDPEHENSDKKNNED